MNSSGKGWNRGSFLNAACVFSAKLLQLCSRYQEHDLSQLHYWISDSILFEVAEQD